MTAEGMSALVVAVLAVGGVIYQAGAISNRFTESRNEREKDIRSLREEMLAGFTTMRNDLNGIGQAHRRLSTDTFRQFHNMNNVIVLIARSEDRAAVVGFLREEKTQ